MARDFLNQEIEVGDTVIYVVSKGYVTERLKVSTIEEVFTDLPIARVKIVSDTRTMITRKAAEIVVYKGYRHVDP